MSILFSKFLIINFLLFLLYIENFAQNDLYIPLNVKKAYEKGTRAYNGLNKNKFSNKTIITFRLFELEISLDKGMKHTSFIN